MGYDPLTGRKERGKDRGVEKEVDWEEKRKPTYGELIAMGVPPEEARKFLRGETVMVRGVLAPEVLERPIKVELTHHELLTVRNALLFVKEKGKEYELLFRKFDKLLEEITAEAREKGRPMFFRRG